MTLPGYPEGFNPDATHGVTGDDGSIPNLPDRTQDAIVDELKQKYVLDNPQISGNLSTIFANLRPGVSLPLAIIEALANRLLGTSTLFLSVEQALLALQKVPIIGDLVEVFTGEEDGDLDDLGTWANNVFTSINQFGDVVAGLIVTPINTAVANFQDWWNGLVGWQDSTTITATDIQNTQIAAVANGVPRQPAWVSPHPLADVSYPLSMHIGVNVKAGDTGPASTGTAHTHSASGGDLRTGTAEYVISQNNSGGSLITITNTLPMDTVSFIGSRDSSVDAAHLDVFKVDASGAAARVATVNVTSDLSTSTSAMVTATLPSTLLCQAGETYLVRFRNASTTAVPIYVTGLVEDAFGPQIGWKTIGSTDTSKTSYTSGEMSTAKTDGTVIFWCALAAVSPPVPELAFSDNFNRQQLGNLWLTKSTTASQPVIIGNSLQYNSATNGNQAGIYVRKTNFNAAKVEANLSVNPLAVLGQRVGIMLHCNQDMSQVVFLGVGTSDSKLYSGGWDSLTERASDSDAGSGLWSLYWDDTASKYIVLKNGDPTGLEWAAGGATVRDENHRFGGARISLNTLITAGSVDNFSLRDWKP